jgi:hypothetical protein
MDYYFWVSGLMLRVLNARAVRAVLAAGRVPGRAGGRLRALRTAGRRGGGHLDLGLRGGVRPLPPLRYRGTAPGCGGPLRGRGAVELLHRPRAGNPGSLTAFALPAEIAGRVARPWIRSTSRTHSMPGAREPTVHQRSARSARLLPPVQQCSGTHRQECLNPKGIPDYPPTSAPEHAVGSSAKLLLIGRFGFEAGGSLAGSHPGGRRFESG